METYRNQQLDEERALYGQQGIRVIGCRFDGPLDGESALKECADIVVEDSFFNLRYPFWHVRNAQIRNCEMTDLCRAALWYDEGVVLEDTKLHGIKALRESSGIELVRCDIVSPEFLWRCRGITLRDSRLESEYALFESEDVTIDRLNMSGKYSFQYVENMKITDSHFHTKDAFWHSKNVTVTDSVLEGEYLGWYSENLRLIRCKIRGTQPLCYCKGLVLEDCEMEETDLAFERSEVNAVIRGGIDSVKNPAGGRIEADFIGELILESEYVDLKKTEICARISD